MVIETIKHFFGFCGEGHTNIFSLMLGLPLLVILVKTYAITCWFACKNFIKKWKI